MIPKINNDLIHINDDSDELRESIFNKRDFLNNHLMGISGIVFETVNYNIIKHERFYRKLRNK